MRNNSKIITIGLCPSWDTVCQLDGVGWGLHSVVNSRSDRPAGKAFNVSRALAWMGQKNTAAGLWGQEDFDQMLKAVEPLRKLVKVKMTSAAGRTRQNITIVDTLNNRQMHLRSISRLASKKALEKLRSDLTTTVTKNSVCVFAGSMPDRNLTQVLSIVNFCRTKGAKLVVDTAGESLRRIVNAGQPWLISPNVDELRELIGKDVRDNTAALAKATKGLLDKVEIILISRGEKGAVVLTSDKLLHGRCVLRRKVVNTVGCGDYLLAGFLAGLRQKQDLKFALRAAIKTATAKAWGLTERLSWSAAQRKIKVKVEK